MADAWSHKEKSHIFRDVSKSKKITGRRNPVWIISDLVCLYLVLQCTPDVRPLTPGHVRTLIGRELFPWRQMSHYKIHTYLFVLNKLAKERFEISLWFKWFFMNTHPRKQKFVDPRSLLTETNEYTYPLLRINTLSRIQYQYWHVLSYMTS